jgi:acetolactate synthase-1/2/3 large subunit
MLGMHGNYAPNKKTNECDVLIAIGMRFDDRVISDVTQYATQAKVIHLEIDQAEINKNIKVEYPVLGDLKETLPYLTQKLNKAQHAEWIQSFAALKEKEEKEVIMPQIQPGQGNLTMGEVIAAISKNTKGNAILVTDVGQHQMMALRYFEVNQSRAVITSGGLGTMGFGLPAAIGAKVAKPQSEVVLFVGDGGIQMTVQELGTIMQSNIAVKIVVLNNGYLGMVRQWQELFFGKRYSFTTLANPDFTVLAKAYNIAALRIDKREELQESIAKMLQHPEAFLLDVHVAPEGNVFPMIPAGEILENIRFK